MKNLILAVFFSFISIVSFGSHVVGGNIEVVQTGANDFTITLSVFRDCSGAVNPDGFVSIRVQGTNTLQTSLTLASITPYVVSLGDSCYTPTGLCVEQWTFQGNVTLPNNPNGYYVVWDDCCRNSGIDNISAPGSAGSLFYTEFPDPAIIFMNSTPQFGPFPSDGYFCINHTLDIPTTVVDPDGDSLSFSLITPYSDGSAVQPFNNVAWAGGYSLANIVGNTTQAPMSIDPVTGTITVHPEQAGVYVFSVLVEEFRGGIKIGETIRDVQYEALNCSFDSPPVINLADSVSVYFGDSICVDMTVSDSDGSDTIYVEPTSVNFDLIGNFQPPTQVGSDFVYNNWNNSTNDAIMDHFLNLGNGVYEGVGTINLRYCWTPTCNDIDTSYTVNLLAYSLGCSGSDTTQKDVVFTMLKQPDPSISLDAPSDTLEVTYGDLICFDILNQTNINVDTLQVVVGSDDFDLSATYVDPSTMNGMSYYTDYFGQDTIWFEDLFVSSNHLEFFGLGLVPLRYCFDPGCESIDEVYAIQLASNTVGCGGSDTVNREYYVEIKYDVEPPAYDVPSQILVKYDSSICFEVMVEDLNNTGLVLGMEPIDTLLNYSEIYEAPLMNSNGAYYVDFMGMDTLYVPNYAVNGLEVNGIGVTGARYCWTPGCGDIVMRNYDLEFESSITTDCFRLTEQAQIAVEVDPTITEIRPIPNVFTPNGDGDNDYFEFSGSNDPCFDLAKIVIYNRWGKVVFESFDSAFSWDGTLKNKGNVNCAEGTYFVIVTGTYGSIYDPTTGARNAIPLDEQYTIQLLR